MLWPGNIPFPTRQPRRGTVSKAAYSVGIPGECIENIIISGITYDALQYAPVVQAYLKWLFGLISKDDACIQVGDEAGPDSGHAEG